MFSSFGWIGAVLLVGAIATPRHSDTAAPAPCVADSNYQRLSFWIGDWEILDTAGVHYAAQHVRPALDGCAITAEWTGRDGNKGLNLSMYDRRSGEWRQVYVANQTPSPSSVSIRRSDASYTGPGIRFISLVDPPNGELARSRVTIMPSGDHRVLQLFEDSNDAGRTWHVLFSAEHRPVKSAQQ